MSRLLIDRLPLHKDGRPYVKIVAGPYFFNSWKQTFIDEALLDTGFSGWIIIPQRMKKQINPTLLKSQLSSTLSPYFISYKESITPEVKRSPSESYSLIQIRIQTQSMGQPIQYEEFSPEIVSFSDKDYAIIGSQFFMKYSLQLMVNYQKRLFSLEQL